MHTRFESTFLMSSARAGATAVTRAASASIARTNRRVGMRRSLPDARAGRKRVARGRCRRRRSIRRRRAASCRASVDGPAGGVRRRRPCVSRATDRLRWALRCPSGGRSATARVVVRASRIVAISSACMRRTEHAACRLRLRAELGEHRARHAGRGAGAGDVERAVGRIGRHAEREERPLVRERADLVGEPQRCRSRRDAEPEPHAIARSRRPSAPRRYVRSARTGSAAASAETRSARRPGRTAGRSTSTVIAATVPRRLACGSRVATSSGHGAHREPRRPARHALSRLPPARRRRHDRRARRLPRHGRARRDVHLQPLSVRAGGRGPLHRARARVRAARRAVRRHLLERPDRLPRTTRRRTLLARSRAKSYGFPYLVDASQDVARAFDAVCTPDIYVFDRERRLAYHGRIDDDWKEPAKVTRRELAAALDAVLAGKAPAAPSSSTSIGCSIKWRRPSVSAEVAAALLGFLLRLAVDAERGDRPGPQALDADLTVALLALAVRRRRRCDRAPRRSS